MLKNLFKPQPPKPLNPAELTHLFERLIGVDMNGLLIHADEITLRLLKNDQPIFEQTYIANEGFGQTYLEQNK